MEVHRILEHVQKSTDGIMTVSDSNRRISWLCGDGGIYYCMVNGASGAGIDIAAALPLKASGGLLWYVDQRRSVAKNIAMNAAALVTPSCLPAGSVVVCGLFHRLASFNDVSELLPYNTFVLSYRNHEAFHGSLSYHPASRPHVNVNHDNVSALRLLKSVVPIVDDILARRREAMFRDVNDFIAFCQEKGCSLMESETDRIVC